MAVSPQRRSDGTTVTQQAVAVRPGYSVRARIVPQSVDETVDGQSTLELRAIDLVKLRDWYLPL